MSDLKITTNWHRRPVIYGYELTEKDYEEFDYLTKDEFLNREFIRYKGELYDMGDVLRAEGEIAALGWDGFNSDSFWSGMAFKYDTKYDPMDEYGYVIVARVTW